MKKDTINAIKVLGGFTGVLTVMGLFTTWLGV
jgi:hypothetical protein